MCLQGWRLRLFLFCSAIWWWLFLRCMTDFFRWSFTYTLTEAEGLLENLSLDSQTKTAGNPAPAMKVSRNLDSWFLRFPYVSLFDSIVNWWYSLLLVKMDQVTLLLIQPIQRSTMPLLNVYLFPYCVCVDCM